MKENNENIQNLLYFGFTPNVDKQKAFQAALFYEENANFIKSSKKKFYEENTDFIKLAKNNPLGVNFNWKECRDYCRNKYAKFKLFYSTGKFAYQEDTYSHERFMEFVANYFGVSVDDLKQQLKNIPFKNHERK